MNLEQALACRKELQELLKLNAAVIKWLKGRDPQEDYESEVTSEEESTEEMANS